MNALLLFTNLVTCNSGCLKQTGKRNAVILMKSIFFTIILKDARTVYEKKIKIYIYISNRWGMPTHMMHGMLQNKTRKQK